MFQFDFGIVLTVTLFVFVKFEVFVSKTTKGPKENLKDQLRSRITYGDEP